MPSLKQKLNRVQKSVQRSKENVEGDLAWYGEFISDMRTQEIAITSAKATSSFVGIVSFIGLFTPLAPLAVAGLVGSGLAGAATAIGDYAASKVKKGRLDERQNKFNDNVEKLRSDVQDFNKTLKTQVEKTKSVIIEGIDFSTYFLSQSLGLMKGEGVMTILDASMSGEIGVFVADFVLSSVGGKLVTVTPRITEVINVGVNLIRQGETALLVVDEIGSAATAGVTYVGQVVRTAFDATKNAYDAAAAILARAVNAGGRAAAVGEVGVAGGQAGAAGGRAGAAGGRAAAAGGRVGAAGGRAVAAGGRAGAAGGRAVAAGGRAGAAGARVIGVAGRGAAAAGRGAVVLGAVSPVLRVLGPALSVGGIAFGAIETIYSAFKGNPTRNAAVEIEEDLLVTFEVYKNAEKTFKTFIDHK